MNVASTPQNFRSPICATEYAARADSYAEYIDYGALAYDYAQYIKHGVARMSEREMPCVSLVPTDRGSSYESLTYEALTV